MKIICIIPARMASSRFPGKPLAKIHGIPMIGHCYKRTNMSELLSECYVATPDNEIFDYIESIGGNAVMTSHSHEMCNDRVAEAVSIIETEKKTSFDIVVNVQGDLPMVFPDMVDSLIKPIIDNKNVVTTTMMDSVTTLEEFIDPNRVKVLCDLFNNAILLTREPVPSRHKTNAEYNKYKHVAIRAYKRAVFSEISNLPMSPAERIEGIDDLRLIENNIKIRVVETKRITETVDNQNDLDRVIEMMENDTLMKEYS